MKFGFRPSGGELVDHAKGVRLVCGGDAIEIAVAALRQGSAGKSSITGNIGEVIDETL